MVICWACFSWEAFATILTGLAAVGSALIVARRQQKIKEQELRLSLLHERRILIRRFQEFQSSLIGRGDMDDEKIRDFLGLVKEVQLYFDQSTAKAVEEVFDDVWQYIATKTSIQLYRDDEMHEEARAEVKKRMDILRGLMEKFPTALKLLVKRTRVPDNL